MKIPSKRKVEYKIAGEDQADVVYNAYGNSSVPNFLPGHPWPSGRPTKKNWANREVEDKRTFNAYVRKLIHMQHTNRCKICGDKKQLSKIWSLNGAFCRTCVVDNFISNYRLLQV